MTAGWHASAREASLPLSPRMPSMLCLAFFSPSSSFLSASSSSSFFPNLILSTRLIELTKPQKLKGKRASISCWGSGAGATWGPGRKPRRSSPPPTHRNWDAHPLSSPHLSSPPKDSHSLGKLTHLGHAHPGVPIPILAHTCASHRTSLDALTPTPTFPGPSQGPSSPWGWLSTLRCASQPCVPGCSPPPTCTRTPQAAFCLTGSMMERPPPFGTHCWLVT